MGGSRPWSSTAKAKASQPAEQQRETGVMHRQTRLEHQRRKHHCKCTCEHAGMLPSDQLPDSRRTGDLTRREDMPRLDMIRRDVMMMMRKPTSSSTILRSNLTRTAQGQRQRQRQRHLQPAGNTSFQHERLTAREPCGGWLHPLSRQHRQLSARLAHSEELPFHPGQR